MQICRGITCRGVCAKAVVLAALFWAATTALSAQQRRHIFKFDLPALAWDRVGGAYEWRLSPKLSLEVNAHAQWHPDQPDWFFNGQLVTYFVMEKTEQLDFLKRVTHTTGWRYRDSAPLPDVPSHITSLSQQYGLALKFSYPATKKGLRYFVAPGAMCTHSEYLSIITENQVVKYYKYQEYANLRHVVLHEQRRTMFKQQDWQFGLSYQIGFSHTWKSGLYLEGRAMAAYHFNLPYEDEPLPARLRRWWVRPALLCGWAF